MLRVDIVSDVVCPWCFVGKRQLEQALARLAQTYPDQPAPSVNWHPFQLNPDLPEQGLSREHYLERKFGRADPGAIYQRVKQAGAQVGLDLPIEGISRQPNTAAAHALMAECEDNPLLADTLAEALFQGYFIQHQDFTSLETLRDIALGAGLSPAQVDHAFSEPALAAVRERDASLREQGITGVPFFVVNESKAVSGAVGADSLFQLLQESMNPSGHTPKNP